MLTSVCHIILKALPNSGDVQSSYSVYAHFQESVIFPKKYVRANVCIIGYLPPSCMNDTLKSNIYIVLQI